MRAWTQARGVPRFLLRKSWGASARIRLSGAQPPLCADAAQRATGRFVWLLDWRFGLWTTFRPFKTAKRARR